MAVWTRDDRTHRVAKVETVRGAFLRLLGSPYGPLSDPKGMARSPILKVCLTEVGVSVWERSGEYHHLCVALELQSEKKSVCAKAIEDAWGCFLLGLEMRQ